MVYSDDLSIVGRPSGAHLCCVPVAAQASPAISIPFHQFVVMALPVTHRIEDLIALFDGLFAQSFNTRLIRGEDEPIYLPCDEQVPYHRIIFAHGFFASALHEIAHWCIAGEARRQLVDFGYWYAPDGRTAAQQKAFEAVEVRPQALEWIFSRAAGSRFYISVDNLSGEATDGSSFRLAVHRQVLSYCEHGLPSRAALFRKALCDFYQTDEKLDPCQFPLEALL
jgi:elongation factor P hydroxylase